MSGVRRDTKRPVQPQAGALAVARKPARLMTWTLRPRLLLCTSAAGVAIAFGEAHLLAAVGLALLAELAGVAWSLRL